MKEKHSLPGKQVMKSTSNIDGILVVDKPENLTSRDVVNRVSRVLGTKHIGHTGTLDPMATGVLVLTIGKCTKLNEYLTSIYKTYEVEAKLGILTDTLDITGKVLDTKECSCSVEEIKSTIESFVCKYMQEVPAYSALKVGGKRLYQYAREGISIELPKREVEITSIDNLQIDDNIVKFTCTVSKGTYIRSLVRDIGEKLGTYGTMVSLRRIVQGGYSIEDAFTLEEIESGDYRVMSPIEVLKGLTNIELDAETFKLVFNGVQQKVDVEADYIVYTYGGNIVALYKKDEDKKFKMYVKF